MHTALYRRTPAAIKMASLFGTFFTGVMGNGGGNRRWQVSQWETATAAA
jgi:hypothetical protein